jgi:hypothetical protein
MASRNESGKIPGTSFAGTLAANGLTPLVPGMACPGVPGVVSVCGSDIADPAIKTAATRKMPRSSQLSLKEGLLPRLFACGAEGKFLKLAGQLLHCDPSFFLARLIKRDP